MILRRRSPLAASHQRVRPRTAVARVSTTVLMIATVFLLRVVIGVAIAARAITRQPPDQPVQVPSVSQI
jgi:hypothetical protein